mmetsp:Transcript_53134/g.124457  ORF Transcript_53134/g.124457 Transcript_53134/m.124457 type:complete len:354 (+) Transcript_53134:731-1792(+)
MSSFLFCSSYSACSSCIFFSSPLISSTSSMICFNCDRNFSASFSIDSCASIPLCSVLFSMASNFCRCPATPRSATFFSWTISSSLFTSAHALCSSATAFCKASPRLCNISASNSACLASTFKAALCKLPSLTSAVSSANCSERLCTSCSMSKMRPRFSSAPAEALPSAIFVAMLRNSLLQPVISCCHCFATNSTLERVASNAHALAHCSVVAGGKPSGMRNSPTSKARWCCSAEVSLLKRASSKATAGSGCFAASSRIARGGTAHLRNVPSRCSAACHAESSPLCLAARSSPSNIALADALAFSELLSAAASSLQVTSWRLLAWSSTVSPAFAMSSGGCGKAGSCTSCSSTSG